VGAGCLENEITAIIHGARLMKQKYGSLAGTSHAFSLPAIHTIKNVLINQ
jgi:hypothetical protein